MTGACWYIAWTLYTVLTQVVYICLINHQKTIFCSILGWFVLFNLESEDPFIGLALRSFWHCLALFVMYKLGMSASFSLIQLISPVNQMYTIFKSSDLSVLTKIVYICLLNHQNTVSCLILVCFVIKRLEVMGQCWHVQVLMFGICFIL